MNQFPSQTIWHRYRTIIIISLLLLLSATIVRFVVWNPDTVPDTDPISTPQTVEMRAAGSFSESATVSVIGTVQSASEGTITSRGSGQVTRVYARTGDGVVAGSIIAELANEQQRASVRQAEAGVAQARAGITSADVSAADRTISIRQAEASINDAVRDARTAITAAYTGAERIVTQDIDPLYSNPQSGVPGVRIGTGAAVTNLNEQRVGLRTTLPAWEQLVANNHNSSINSDLNQSVVYINEVSQLVNTIIDVLENARADQTYTDTRLRELRLTFNNHLETLSGLRSSAQSAGSRIQNAEDALERAQIADVPTDRTRTDADIAQAEAALDSARAELNNTLIRSPISGTINELDITIGDFVSTGSILGQLANNQSMQIEVFVSPRERVGLTVGDTVSIGRNSTGTITDIAPTIDVATRKQKITIATDDQDLTVNDTVRIHITVRDTAMASDGLRVPISAIQFSGTDGSVLIVNDEGTLEAIPVTLGNTRNNLVEIVDGITSDTMIVTDVRGKRAGQAVRVETYTQ